MWYILSPVCQSFFCISCGVSHSGMSHWSSSSCCKRVQCNGGYHDHEDSIKQVSKDKQKIMLQICPRHPKFTRTCQVKISQTCQSVSSATRPVCILPGSKAFDSTAKTLLIGTTEKTSASSMLHPAINASFMCPEIPGIAEATARESDDVVGTNVATCYSRFLCRCNCYHHASSRFTATVVGRRLPSRSSRMFLQ